MNNRSSFSGKLGFVLPLPQPSHPPVPRQPVLPSALEISGVFHIWRRSTEAAHSFWFI